jgi:hypothetical protein
MTRPSERDLTDAVASAVGERVVGIRDFRADVIGYDAFLAGRTVRRIGGTARTERGAGPWTLIEKRTDGHPVSSADLLENARREMAAYRSGVLDDLAPRLRAPRLHGTRELDGGGVTLWLEDLGTVDRRPRTATEVAAVARSLGALAGSWIGRPPAHAWAFRGWIDRHMQVPAIGDGLAILERAKRHDAAAALLGRRLDEAIELVRRQDEVRSVLDGLPVTLCHHDAVASNVTWDPETATAVLIDWESVGPGPVGADLASLLFSSPRRGDFPATVTASLVPSALDAYRDGMAEAGAAVDGATVRRGVDAAIALRWTLVRDVAESIIEGRRIVRGSAPAEAAEDALADLLVLVDVLLAAAHRTLSV